MAGGLSRWLLIGNSRWHWAERAGAGLRVWHRSASEQARLAPMTPSEWPLAWAATGMLPASLQLPAERRVELAAVPLAGMPPWLGVDRALAGWEAWRRFAVPVLVADAGTVLSLTRVDATGSFAGGRLLAGMDLQLRAMAAGTAALPELGRGSGRPDACGAWPADTAAAMRSGVCRGLAAAVAEAAREVASERSSTRLVLTGGDAAELAPLVEAGLRRCERSDGEPPGIGVELLENLCLEALVRLAPELRQVG
ncbi:MAG: type III pantothenate kinase [Synechococcaceae cyanobacterium]|nr:type III pantothenate kinase [Synechococcaceae cyanobacterium]